jgi:hypothetical protein
MPIKIIVEIPDSIGPYHSLLQGFFEGMIMKLDKNSHKNTPAIKDIPAILECLADEVAEFEEQFLLDKYNFNTLVELMDAANYAFLAYVVLRNQGVKHEDAASDYNPPRS